MTATRSTVRPSHGTVVLHERYSNVLCPALASLAYGRTKAGFYYVVLAVLGPDGVAREPIERAFVQERAARRQLATFREILAGCDYQRC